MNKNTRKNAKKMEFYGRNLDECVEFLLEFQRNGESVVVEVNGHKLYSCDVTMDSAYIEITGLTKAEFDKEKKEESKERQEREETRKRKAEGKISYWIEQGKAFIYPERMEDWKKCVETRAGDLYHGDDLDWVLDLMEKLECGASMRKVKKMFNEQGPGGEGADIVRRMMLLFAKKGPEFYESTAIGMLSKRRKTRSKK